MNSFPNLYWVRAWHKSSFALSLRNWVRNRQRCHKIAGGNASLSSFSLRADQLWYARAQRRGPADVNFPPPREQVREEKRCCTVETPGGVRRHVAAFPPLAHTLRWLSISPSASERERHDNGVFAPYLKYDSLRVVFRQTVQVFGCVSEAAMARRIGL